MKGLNFCLALALVNVTIRQGPVTRTIARVRLTGKMADDDLVCPPPVSACDY